ncbi:LytR/AlgR family response regulator transcription factor [Xanthovirga aplysinae]|uniref:LytR/AlgR family response regulator transcription factor n=1 Tax=Xanthovirga aplysinae TaxID=2529853 RepID=UPI0012BB7D86|nr:LytTR family DNA-binding domain-containing protein [Xanthovirga aplysinae]MTI31502.1 response regulator transcription factor [Xanthovirga aplysinae]
MSQLISCLIIEDEPAAQDILKKYINDNPNLYLVQCCNNAIEALEILNNAEIQLIFLDINMPKLSGLQLYKSLSNPPKVIFTTAYPEYALEGFEVDAVDYLLKPFTFERFLKAVQKYISLSSKEPIKQSEPFILLKADKKIHKINFEDIFFLEAKGDYVKVTFSNTFILVHSTLQALQAQLPNHQFIRIHKSFIISLNHLDIIEGNMAKLKDYSIPIGQIYKISFLEMIKKRSGV